MLDGIMDLSPDLEKETYGRVHIVREFPEYVWYDLLYFHVMPEKSALSVDYNSTIIELEKPSLFAVKIRYLLEG